MISNPHRPRGRRVELTPERAAATETTLRATMLDGHAPPWLRRLAAVKLRELGEELDRAGGFAEASS